MTIKSPSGRVYQWNKETPPSEADMAALQEFDARQAAPEIVAGTPAQMSEQRARNLQRELGLEEPVAPQGQPGSTIPFRVRMASSMAPTAPEKQAYFDAQYGKFKHFPISEDNSLINVPDGNGGSKWVLENPAGLDTGDLASLVAHTPQIIAGGVAALGNAPGAWSPLAKAAAASGAAAFAGNVAGAIQDAVFRVATDTPVNPEEIAKRRGLGAGIEAVAGTILPMAADRVVNTVRGTNAMGAAVKAFIKEGDAAKAVLKKQGIDVADSSMLADAIRAREAGGPVADAGQKIASALNEFDKTIRGGSQRMLEGAGRNLEQRAVSQLGGPVSMKPSEVGNVVVGGTKNFVEQQKKSISRLYDDAYAEIDGAAKASGQGKFFVELKKTADVLNEIKNRLPRTDAGEVAATFQPLRAQINELEQMTGATQKLDAMRLTRTLVGERLKGKGGPFENVSTDLAEKLYASISQDIDDSIRAFNGPGADKLRVANEAYKNLVQPFEHSKLLDDIVNDAYQLKPEDLVGKLASASTGDWAVLKTALGGGPAYNIMRRSVADSLMGSAEVRLGSQSFADLSTLSRNINSLAKDRPEVLDEIFGGRAGWQAMKRLADEQAYLVSKRGIFTNTALPKQEELMEARKIAEEQGFDSANSFIKRAIGAAEQRRASFADSLVSQARSGNSKFLTENAEQFADAFIFSGRHDARYVAGVMKRLPDDVREDVSRAAFQQLFERSRQAAQSTVERTKNSYSVEKMVNEVFGSQQSQARVRAAIGDERFELAKNWMKYQLSLEMKLAKPEATLRRAAGLISTAPYQNLFAARAASFALEKAAGSKFISGATPDAVELFSQARVLEKHPVKSALGITTIQRAIQNPQYGNYLAMMQDFTPEQQDAIDQYLLGK